METKYLFGGQFGLWPGSPFSGAGVAGLSADWLLQHQGINFVIVEKQPHAGEPAQSFECHQFNRDLATHRLYTINKAVLQQLLNLVPMGRHVRHSRIIPNRNRMRDPLEVIELETSLAILVRLKVIWTYVIRLKGLPVENYKTT